MAGEKMKVPAFSLEDFDRVIHSPARLLIMKILYVLDGADMVFLKAETGLTWGNLSVQIKNLEEAGYVAMQKEFVDNRPHTLISMTRQGRAAFKNYSERLKELLL
jgi:DNA-binding MarR family transcriptional regulator